MRSGNWPDQPVQQLTARVLLDGVPTDVDEVQLTSEMTAALSVVEADGMAVTTGTAAWRQPAVVASSSPQPFVRSGNWPPRQGTPLTVEVGDGGDQWWQHVVGYVDSTSGSVTDAGVQSKIIDLVDRLSRGVRHDALLSSQPPNVALPGADVDQWRRVRLCSVYVTDLCARTAGFYATPAAGPATVLSAPCVGSAWAHIGEVVTAHLNGDVTSPPRFTVAVSWGAALAAPDVTWQFENALRPSYATATVQLAKQGGCRLDLLREAGGVGIYVDHATDGTITVGVRLPSLSPVATFARGDAERLALAYVFNHDLQQVTMTIRLSDGREITAASPVSSTWSSADAHAGLARIYGDGVMGGVVVDAYAQGDDRWRALNTPVTAVLRPGQLFELVALPALTGESALSLLTTQAKAECASLWLDSSGRLRWVGVGLLEADAAVAVKSTELTLDDLAWTDDLAHAREEVVMKRHVPAVKKSLTPTVPLADLQAVTFSRPGQVETWLEPGGDDWIMPDLVLKHAGTGTWLDSPRIGSFYGGAITQDDTSDETQLFTNDEQLVGAIERIGDSYKLTQQALIVPAGKVLVTQVPNTNTPAYLRGDALPFFRGYGLVTWADVQTIYDTGIAAPTPTYEHECSWFLQNDDDLQTIAAWIVAQVANPTPAVNSVEIAYDPRLELGDKVILTDPHRTGLEIDLVITHLDQSITSGAPAMTISGRITRIAKPYTIDDPTPSWQQLLEGWRGAQG